MAAPLGRITSNVSFDSGPDQKIHHQKEMDGSVGYGKAEYGLLFTQSQHFSCLENDRNSTKSVRNFGR
jgi:hypothetical protein